MSQNMIALKIANERKVAHAGLRRRVRAGLPLADALEDPASHGLKVWKLIGSMPQWGPGRIMRLEGLLARKGVSIGPDKRCHELTARQKMILLDEFRKPEPKVRVVKPPAKKKSGRPTGPRLRCPVCGAGMRVPADMCGFCRVETADGWEDALRKEHEERNADDRQLAAVNAGYEAMCNETKLPDEFDAAQTIAMAAVNAFVAEADANREWAAAQQPDHPAPRRPKRGDRYVRLKDGAIREVVETSPMSIIYMRTIGSRYTGSWGVKTLADGTPNGHRRLDDGSDERNQT